MPESTPLEKHEQIKVWNAEDWLYEDFEIGRKDRSICRTISEGEAMLFNSLVLDMHPYVGDEIFAKKGIFGRRLVAGSMVFSYGLGLMAHNNFHAFSYGYDKLRFPKPVFIGDTLHTRVTVKEKREDPKRKGLGRVIEACEVLNQRDEVVLYCEHILLAERRSAASESS